MSSSRTTSRPRILDGGLATELERIGEPVDAPWWTNKPLLVGARRERLRALHEEFVDAGAEVLTANTFRCNRRTLRGLGFDPSSGMAWMVHAAVGTAQAAARRSPSVRTAASVGPVADCYRPEAVPSDEELRAEHRWLATELARCGIELFLVETMNTVREARIAVEEAVAVGGVPWVGFVCGDGGRLLSGEPVAEAAGAVREAGARLVAVNCTDLVRTETALAALRADDGGAIGAYPNLEDRRAPRTAGGRGPHPSALGPEDFAEVVAGWDAEFGLDLVGGCCGTTPDHVAALRRAVREAAGTAARDARP
ncbi:homocysteine methyltransferase [Nocardiopsis sp. CNR-923]|uniref:homocysteine S-methyltransferase family protein n=1 Tax=Nocardiopsis sp. CNR-923 TaxID=1904965 RepID=UPI0009655FEB|nr:homocysteine S-methyltransferase family protein [Nocardiopsis sp. CNR-923]OLT29953.1 homocysteine methyltransferase [Nocardiopsis sp. CNR-923]